MSELTDIEKAAAANAAAALGMGLRACTGMPRARFLLVCREAVALALAGHARTIEQFDGIDAEQEIASVLARTIDLAEAMIARKQGAH